MSFIFDFLCVLWSLLPKIFALKFYAVVNADATSTIMARKTGRFTQYAFLIILYIVIIIIYFDHVVTSAKGFSIIVDDFDYTKDMLHIAQLATRTTSLSTTRNEGL